MEKKPQSDVEGQSRRIKRTKKAESSTRDDRFDVQQNKKAKLDGDSGTDVRSHAEGIPRLTVSVQRREYLIVTAAVRLIRSNPVTVILLILGFRFSERGLQGKITATLCLVVHT